MQNVKEDSERAMFRILIWKFKMISEDCSVAECEGGQRESYDDLRTMLSELLDEKERLLLFIDIVIIYIIY